jgi:hypothetical protein
MVPPACDSARSSSRSSFNSLRQLEGKDDERTYIARLMVRMDACFEKLGVESTADETVRKMESMSILIHESMSISSRNYHSVQHVFDISKHLDDPIAILSALFHDCVYHNIDGGLSDIQKVFLQGVLLVEDKEDGPPALKVHPDSTADKLLSLVIQIYGFVPGQELTPMTGLNEFLSAVIAVRELEFLLPLPSLARIACCIEATIPFRPDIDGKSCSERLYERMLKASSDFSLNMSDNDCVVAVQQAAILSNEDVGNFGSEDQLWFLDNTWSLLPESNEALRKQYLYTVKDFQFAVFKMTGFFGFLKPTVVFQQFHGVPPDEEMNRLTNNCRRNLEVGKKYVAAKLLSISVLAAFAELTGGDAPISLFMGDLPSRHHVSRRLEDALPQAKTTPHEGCDEVVYNILAHGRRSETAFDVRQSPLAAYFYSFLGDEGVEKILSDIKVYPMSSDTATALLTKLPREAVLHVSGSMINFAISRRKLIRNLVEQLPVV